MDINPSSTSDTPSSLDHLIYSPVDLSTYDDCSAKRYYEPDFQAILNPRFEETEQALLKDYPG